MAKPTMTYEIAMAASRDAGNRHAKQAGRSVWAVADWNAACEKFERLWPKAGTEQETDYDFQRS